MTERARKDANRGKDITQNKPAKWRDYYSKAMIIWAVVAHVFLLLQAIKIYSDQNATGVSLPAYVVYECGAVIWFTYGMFVLEKRNPAIITSAVTAFTLGMIVLVGVIIYGDKEQNCNEQIEAAAGAL